MGAWGKNLLFSTGKSLEGIQKLVFFFFVCVCLFYQFFQLCLASGIWEASTWVCEDSCQFTSRAMAQSPTQCLSMCGYVSPGADRCLQHSVSPCRQSFRVVSCPGTHKQICLCLSAYTVKQDSASLLASQWAASYCLLLSCYMFGLWENQSRGFVKFWSLFGAHLGVCKNKSSLWCPVQPKRSKWPGENKVNTALIWWIPPQGLTKIPGSAGKGRPENKPASCRPSMLVTIFAHFSRFIYFAENFCEVLWVQDAIWRRETQFSQEIERPSMPETLFNSEKYCFYWEHWVLRHKQWKAQKSKMF